MSEKSWQQKALEIQREEIQRAFENCATFQAEFIAEHGNSEKEQPQFNQSVDVLVDETMTDAGTRTD